MVATFPCYDGAVMDTSLYCGAILRPGYFITGPVSLSPFVVRS